MIGRVLTEVLDGLRVGLCEALADLHPAEEGRTCFCALMPGAQAPADWCSCGGARGGGCAQAWVRLDRVFPSAAFPVPDLSATSCSSPVAAVVELGVLRCVPQPGAQGRAPGEEQQTNAVLRNLIDVAAMHRTLTCTPAITKRSAVAGTYTPRDSGDCAGGVWPVTVLLTRV